MKKLTLALTGLFVAGSLLASAAEAQNAPAPPAPAARQRAPGVPLAPRPDDITRSKAGERGQTHREARDARASQPDRDLPMPRGVPSIIAPTR